jgi:hypothetical protein
MRVIDEYDFINMVLKHKAALMPEDYSRVFLYTGTNQRPSSRSRPRDSSFQENIPRHVLDTRTPRRHILTGRTSAPLQSRKIYVTKKH